MASDRPDEPDPTGGRDRPAQLHDTTEAAGDRTVVFVCPHGIGKSRMAAALFEAGARASGLDGWSTSTAAGEEPGEALSRPAAALLAGSSAQAFLEPGPGRPVTEMLRTVRDDRALVVAIDGELRDVEPDHRWWLSSDRPDERMREELTLRVAELIDGLLASSGGPDER